MNREFTLDPDSFFPSPIMVLNVHRESFEMNMGEGFYRTNTLIAIMIMFFALIVLFRISSFRLVWGWLRKIKVNVYGFALLMLLSMGLFFYDQYLKSFWNWLCSDKAGNLGSFLLALVALASFFYGPYLFRRWQEKKSAEKMSDIAEHGLNNLYTFLDEIKTWLKFSRSWMVYSRYSEKNLHKKEMLLGKEREEFVKNLDADPYEMHNYCKSGDAIIINLQSVIPRVKRLSDPVIDEKIKALYEHTRKLPGQLFNIHFVNSTKEDKEGAEAYLRDASDAIEKKCSDINDLLMKYLMFKK